MSHERAIETCDFYRVTGTTPFFAPDSSILNGGTGQTVAATSRIASARLVAVYGFYVSGGGSTFQFNVGTGSTPVVGMLYSSSAIGMNIFPAPILLKPPAGTATVDFSVSNGSASTVYVYYRVLA